MLPPADGHSCHEYRTQSDRYRLKRIDFSRPELDEINAIHLKEYKEVMYAIYMTNRELVAVQNEMKLVVSF